MSYVCQLGSVTGSMVGGLASRRMHDPLKLVGVETGPQRLSFGRFTTLDPDAGLTGGMLRQTAVWEADFFLWRL